MYWKIRGSRLSLENPLLMGILNLTPDSFSDGGKFLGLDQSVGQAVKMAEEGADILDLGAESTRPGAETVSEEEELRRLLPCLEAVLSRVSIPISIDTTKAAVAEACLKIGAHIINDVSGLQSSGAQIVNAVRRYGAGLVVMHRRGDAKSMQSLTQYGDVTEDVISELRESLKKTETLDPEQVAVDPGLGFSKTSAQNLEILRNLERFHALQRPVLLGPSRKSFLGEITGREPEERQMASAAVCVQAVLKGVQILRVHDIGPARDAVRVASAIRGEKHVRS